MEVGKSSIQISKKLAEMQKLEKNKKQFKIIAIIMLTIDLLAFFPYNLIKYHYMFHILDPESDFLMLLLKLSLQGIFSIVLSIFLLKEFRKILLFGMICYIIIGSVYAFIILLDNLLSTKASGDRIIPYDIDGAYYLDNVYILVMILNGLSWFSKVVSSITIGLFYFFNENFESEFEINNQNTNIIYYSKKVNMSSKMSLDDVDNKQYKQDKNKAEFDNNADNNVLSFGSKRSKDSYLNNNQDNFDNDELEDEFNKISNDDTSILTKEKRFSMKIHY